MLPLMLCAWLLAGSPDDVISTMDEPVFRPVPGKAAVEAVPGKVGGALRFRFEPDARGAFAIGNIRGTPEWDKAAGFSFWVKGEGTDGFGGLEFIFDEDYAVRYDVAFPVKGTEWTKVVIAWDDLIPVLPGPKARPLGGPSGNSPSMLAGPWVGKWWYWGDYPALTFFLDDIRLESKIVRDAVPAPPDGTPLARTLSKLKAGRPITIVTMGDSLTDTRHRANRKVVWPSLLKDRLKSRYGSQVTIVNPAIGGTQLRQNLVLMLRWLDRTPKPDLVTVFFGGNDWDAGMRRGEFQRACVDAIDRIRRATGGSSDVLLITTNPAVARWTEGRELAEACRAAAADRRAGLADTDRAFHEAGKDDPARLFVDDRVHLSLEGHGLVADVVAASIVSGGD